MLERLLHTLRPDSSKHRDYRAGGKTESGKTDRVDSKFHCRWVNSLASSRPFIKEISIENFRCFKDSSIELAIPDGTPGSGLNLFVGNNGRGKTSVLDAIDYLFGGRYKAENKLNIRDFNDFEKPIMVLGKTDRFSVKSGLQAYRDKYFNCTGVEFTASPRNRKQPGKLLSAPINAKSVYSLDEDKYFNENTNQPYIRKGSGETRAVDPRELLLETNAVGPNGINVFYFDKNRARHLISGTYRTTFDAICDDLNWKFQKKLRDEGLATTYATKVSNGLFDWVMEVAQKGTGAKLGEQFSEFFNNDGFKDLRIEMLSLLEPFSSAFLAIRTEGKIQQITARSLGSGVELILALLLQRLLSESAKGDKIILIDEPEMHLHPTAQKKLADLLLEESKLSQVIVSSHSPYILQCLVKYGLTNVFSINGKGNIEIEPQSATHGYFPWSPSFGEVNFKAFEMPTVDFHNELYGHVQEQNNLNSCPKMDEFLNTKGNPSNHTWKNSKTGKTESVTECTFVRNSIHHPENSLNPDYDEAMLDRSIKKLIATL